MMQKQYSSKIKNYQIKCKQNIQQARNYFKHVYQLIFKNSKNQYGVNNLKKYLTTMNSKLKKWNDFLLHQDIISALKQQNKNKPTAVQIQLLSLNLKHVQDKAFREKLIENEIFRSQGIVIVANQNSSNIKEAILKKFLYFGISNKSQKLNFSLGRLDKQGHIPGDIIICQAKSILNRQDRENLRRV